MSFITVRGARLHNLKNVSLSIPKNKLVVFTGVSGSGKSTMAFDTLHQEGQRQYMESLGMVTYASKPPIDSISGLSPSISVDQGLSNRSPRSTVGTATEVFTYLRVLFARVGHRPCPQCGRDVPPAHEGGFEGLWDDEADELPGLDEAIVGAAQEMRPTSGRRVGGLPALRRAPARDEHGHVLVQQAGRRLPHLHRAGHDLHPRPGPPAGRRQEHPRRRGGRLGCVSTMPRHAETLRSAGRHYGFDFDPALPIRALGPVQRDLLLYGVEGQPFRRHFPGVEPPATVAKGRFEGIVTTLLRRHAEHASDAEYLEKIERFLIPQTCPDCGGARLRPESRAVTVAGAPAGGRAPSAWRDPLDARPTEALSRLPLLALAEWIDGLRGALPGEDWLIAEPIVTDLRERVRRLVEVGLGYLTLERATPSLSAGEAQRLRLAALLGSGLTGVLYVLDEPTIGLHPRDTPRLINMLRALRDLGNTVLVIEHDLEMIASADWVVDFGPGGGRNGGQIVAQGTPEQVAASSGLADRALPERRGGDPRPRAAPPLGRPVSDHPRRARAQPAGHHRAFPPARSRTARAGCWWRSPASPVRANPR